MGTSPSRAGGGGDAPVDSVSWYEAVQFCEKLSALFGFDGSTPDRAPFRLPTEAEWEWAASGGVQEDRQVTPETGWYAENSGNQTHPVGLKKPNAFGLHDTLGNVWEWTDTAQGSNRVGRGGGWYFSAQRARVALRYWFDPGFRNDNLGLRLARG
ncbi:MAG: formylglycine-generating enzyme family protein [Betaproteobacteria bacterium]|nr:formylglycine-generating enzyme family protein [Betaproteobacteria bacterium]